MKIRKLCNQYLSSEKGIKRFMLFYIVAFGMLLLTHAFLRNIDFAEEDSLVLPVIPLQYRGSIFINESDLGQAKIDFPELYGEVDVSTYLPHLPSVKNQQREWLSYYFPIYSMVCLPAKLLLQLIGFPQIRAFTLTNAILVIFSLLTIYRFLKVSDGEKLLAILLLSFSPIVLYVHFATAESMLFSFATIALVLYHERHYKASAILVVLAGWENPTIMVLGMVMIANFLIDIMKEDIGKPLKEIIRRNVKKVFSLAACYVWCFIPFIINYFYLDRLNATFGMAAANGWFGRFVAYFFDYNLGFASFALFLVVFAIVTLPCCIIKKNYSCIYYYAALIGTVAAFSLAYHINCAMAFCARYVMWSYPILVFICIENGRFLLKNKVLYKLIGVLLSFSCLFFIMWGAFFEGYHGYYHNAFAKVILDNIPQLYNPLPSTFYCRTKHIYGGYWEEDICVYYDSNDDTQARKILLLGTEENKMNLLNRMIISGNKDKFIDMVNSIPNDDKFHYINVSKNAGFSVREANNEERGIIKEKEILIVNSDMEVFLSGDNTIDVFAYPIKIKPYTCYKINITLDEESLRTNVSICYVDLYGQNGRYDRGEQQVELYSIDKGINSNNTIFIETDDIPDGAENIFVRLIAVSEDPVLLTNFSVTEMSYTNSLSNYLSGNMHTSEISKNTIIKPFTDYIITVNCNDYDISSNEHLFLDFYGGASYDSIEQQRDITPGGVNTFIFNSGDTSSVNGIVDIRVVAATELPVLVSVPVIQEAKNCYYGEAMEINFTGDNYNAAEFVERGISHKEDGFSWTLGDSMHVEIPTYGNIEAVKVSISVVGTFGEQSYRVLQGGNEIVSGRLNGEGEISFMAAISDNMIKFDIDLPDSRVFSEVNPESTDGRKGALQIYRMLIDDAK